MLADVKPLAEVVKFFQRWKTAHLSQPVWLPTTSRDVKIFGSHLKDLHEATVVVYVRVYTGSMHICMYVYIYIYVCWCMYTCTSAPQGIGSRQSEHKGTQQEVVTVVGRGGCFVRSLLLRVTVRHQARTLKH